MRKDI
jgi:hypothetical protein